MCLFRYKSSSPFYGNWSFYKLKENALLTLAFKVMCYVGQRDIKYILLVGSLKMNTTLEYSTRVVQKGDRRCKKSTLNDLAYLTPLRIPLWYG